MHDRKKRSNNRIEPGTRKIAQLDKFAESLKEAGYKGNDKLNSWNDAFNALKEVIKESNQKKKVVFIDELSWMDTKDSGLISALESFWNGWVTARAEKDVILIVCASATYQILQCYMIMGGIPYYWSLLKKGKSLPQNIDNLFFKEGAPLSNEYENLYSASHIAVQILLLYMDLDSLQALQIIIFIKKWFIVLESPLGHSGTSKCIAVHQKYINRIKIIPDNTENVVDYGGS